MKCKELIELLNNKIKANGEDVEVKIYDHYCAQYREITGVPTSILFDDFIIDIGEDDCL